MGSLDAGVPLKRENLLRSSSGRSERHQFLQRPRSRISRFLAFKKLDYLQWICTVVVFFFFVVIFQIFLPGSVVDKSEAPPGEDLSFMSEDLMSLKDMGCLDFGEDIRFEPSKLLEKFRSEAKVPNLSSEFSRKPRRFGHRKPLLALVFADLVADPHQILMVTVAAALQDIGYAMQVYSLEDGPVHAVWRNLGVPVTIFQNGGTEQEVVDWLNYDVILVNSLESRSVLSRLVQEPFRSLPLIWTIHESALATRLRQYNLSGQSDLINDWKRIFSRATVVVFPSYVMPMIYSTIDAGNFFVIPSSPALAWEAENFVALHKDNQRVNMGYGPEDFIITIVGSQFLYRGLWLEHALVLKALLPLVLDSSYGSNFNSHLKVVILSGDLSHNYSVAVEAIAHNLGYPRGILKHIFVDEDVEKVLSLVDIVIYGSFLEEPSFPEILLKAMCFSKVVVAPDLSIIRKYVNNSVNGYLFPKENISSLTQIILQLMSNRKLSRTVASVGKHTAKNLKAWDTIKEYALLLETVAKFPSEVATPKPVSEIGLELREQWQWDLFKRIRDPNLNRRLKCLRFLDEVQKQRNDSLAERFGKLNNKDEVFSYSIWEEEKIIAMANAKKRREEIELKDRTDQPHGTWEEVYRSAKRVDRSKNDLHERDERELERTGQPLCIYEPYFGEGVWPFLHQASLYRGIGLSTKGRRPGTDDIDASARLPILDNSYYRDILGEYGAFFAIANRIDRIHKNAWIGFQSWRATARKASLSNIAERSLLNAIESRKHGDTLYFWARMDMDPRSPLRQDFWSFCDAINAGNCKFAFAEALRKTYGIKGDWDSLPPMPRDGYSWSVMNSWVLPTRSFLEFVMFSRMFVDALDAQFYDDHHQSGDCLLSTSKDKHCYSRVLELLINVWTYHSARRMVYVDPETGAMQEHHRLNSRRGQMWIKWFSYATLKSVDEDLAEQADSDRPKKRWLWPSTGEVYWQGVYERERSLRQKIKEIKKKERNEKRIRHRPRQRVLGKYVKPIMEQRDLNSTLLPLVEEQGNLNS